MAIFRGSRYEGVQFTAIKQLGGGTIRYLHPRQHVTPDQIDGQIIRQTVPAGQPLDMFSRLYGELERRWWLVADLNQVFYFHDVREGDKLLVPPQEAFARF